VTRVTASAFSEGRVYASFNGHHFDHFNPYLFISENYGETWKEIDGELPFEPINVVKEDVLNENLLFVGTDNGVYASLDRGKTFMAMNGDLPRVAVHDLVVHPREKELVLGTHGRSIYIASVREIEMLTDSILQKPLFALYTNFNKNYNSGLGKKQNPFDADAVGDAIQIPYYAKSSGLSTVRIKSEKGILLKTFSDSSEAGLNYVKYNFQIDSSDVNDFEKSFGGKKKTEPVQLKKSEDGNYYLLPGKYFVEITDASGNKVSTSITLKSREEEGGGDAKHEAETEKD
jgi:hypothetical protein